jgi:hypothetical protein
MSYKSSRDLAMAVAVCIAMPGVLLATGARHPVATATFITQAGGMATPLQEYIGRSQWENPGSLRNSFLLP